MEETVQNFLNRLIQVERELEKIGRDCLSLSTPFDGNAFPEQHELSVQLASRVDAITHDLASEIGFQRNDIEDLLKFITFRRTYAEFDDAQLKEIIDTDVPSLSLTRQLSKGNDAKHTIAVLNEVRRQWNKVFTNRAYASVRDIFRKKGLPNQAL